MTDEVMVRQVIRGVTVPASEAPPRRRPEEQDCKEDSKEEGGRLLWNRPLAATEPQ